MSASTSTRTARCCRSRSRTGVRLLVQGPDGIPLSAPCRITGATGETLTREFIDIRPVVRVMSTERSGISWITFVPDVPLGATVTVGGGAWETVEWRLDAELLGRLAADRKLHAVLRAR